MPIDMRSDYQTVEIVYEAPNIKHEDVYTVLQRKNKIATDSLGLKTYNELCLESGSNSVLSFEIEADEYSKQMKLVKNIMRKNQAVLKRLAE